MNIKHGNHLLDHGPDDYTSFMQTEGEDGDWDGETVCFYDNAGKKVVCGEKEYDFCDSTCERFKAYQS